MNEPIAPNESQIPAQCTAMETALEKLHAVITDLTNRMDTVTRKQASLAAEAKEAPVLVPLAENLRGYVERVNGATERLVELIELTEL